MINTTKNLAKLAEIMNKYGTDSEQVVAFVAKHKDDPEFVSLSQVSIDLKRAFLLAPDSDLPKSE